MTSVTDPTGVTTNRTRRRPVGSSASTARRHAEHRPAASTRSAARSASRSAAQLDRTFALRPARAAEPRRSRSPTDLRTTFDWDPRRPARPRSTDRAVALVAERDADGRLTRLDRGRGPHGHPPRPARPGHRPRRPASSDRSTRRHRSACERDLAGRDHRRRPRAPPTATTTPAGSPRRSPRPVGAAVVPLRRRRAAGVRAGPRRRGRLPARAPRPGRGDRPPRRHRDALHLRRARPPRRDQRARRHRHPLPLGRRRPPVGLDRTIARRAGRTAPLRGRRPRPPRRGRRSAGPVGRPPHRPPAHASAATALPPPRRSAAGSTAPGSSWSEPTADPWGSRRRRGDPHVGFRNELAGVRAGVDGRPRLRPRDPRVPLARPAARRSRSARRGRRLHLRLPRPGQLPRPVRAPPDQPAGVGRHPHSSRSRAASARPGRRSRTTRGARSPWSASPPSASASASCPVDRRSVSAS